MVNIFFIYKMDYYKKSNFNVIEYKENKYNYVITVSMLLDGMGDLAYLQDCLDYLGSTNFNFKDGLSKIIFCIDHENLWGWGCCGTLLYNTGYKMIITSTCSFLKKIFKYMCDVVYPDNISYNFENKKNIKEFQEFIGIINSSDNINSIYNKWEDFDFFR